MRFNDPSDPEFTELKAYLEDLITYEYLDPESAAAGVVRLFLARGPDAFTASQQYVFEHYVPGMDGKVHCDCCSQPVPLSEMLTWMRSGQCSYCEHQFAKAD